MADGGVERRLFVAACRKRHDHGGVLECGRLGICEYSEIAYCELNSDSIVGLTDQ